MFGAGNLSEEQETHSYAEIKETGNQLSYVKKDS